MKRLLHTPLALLVWRIALLYAALMLCRAAFWVYNAALLGPPVWSELGQLVAGSLKFDTVSVVYADGVFILLSLLPLHLRLPLLHRQAHLLLHRLLMTTLPL